MHNIRNETTNIRHTGDRWRFTEYKMLCVKDFVTEKGGLWLTRSSRK
jgi:hypothetical protein